MNDNELRIQRRLAWWASAFASGSFVVALAGLIVLLGIGSDSWFWARAGILVGACLGVVTLLERVKRPGCRFRRQIWATAAVYFTSIVLLVGLTIRSLGTALVLTLPEIVGLALAVTGWVHCGRKEPISEVGS